VIRAVVDTSVLVSAFIGRADAAPAQVVQAARDGRLLVVVSPQLIAELRGVLARPKFTRWAGDGRGDAFAAGLAAIAEHHADESDPPQQHATVLSAETGIEVVRPADLLARLADD